MTITTLQNIKIELISNVLGLRILASIIDMIIFWLLLLGIILSYTYFTTEFFTIKIDEQIFGLFLYVLLLPVFFYSFLTELIFNGQTLGKMICGIKVVKIQGYHCGFVEYLMRWLFRLIDIYPFFFFSFFFSKLAFMGNFLIGIPAVLTIAFSKSGQRLGDIVAGTTVVKIKDRKDLSITILHEVEEFYQPKFPQVIRLSDNDMRIIKDTFVQAQKFNDLHTIFKLRKKIEKVTLIESDMADTLFMRTIIKDFNYYTKEMK